MHSPPQDLDRMCLCFHGHDWQRDEEDKELTMKEPLRKNSTMAHVTPDVANEFV